MMAWHVDQRRSVHGTRLSAWAKRDDGAIELVTVAGRDAGAIYREAHAEIHARNAASQAYVNGVRVGDCTIVRAP